MNPNKPVPKRGVYLLPNLLTSAALFAAFYSIISGIGGRFEVAAIAVIVAGFLDGMDGRVARLIKMIALRIFISFFEEILISLYHNGPVPPNKLMELHVIIVTGMDLWNIDGPEQTTT